MNYELERLAKTIALADPVNERLRLEFGYLCVFRVRHLLEQPEVEQCLCGLASYLFGAIDRSDFSLIAADAIRLANGHQGSTSIDGCGHAAVSATYAVAKAAEGKALEAASYAAYAAVYAQGGYGAVGDRESFALEFGWQLNCLESLVLRAASPA